MIANVSVGCASTLEELWAGGFASRGGSDDIPIDWNTKKDASCRERFSRPDAICN